LPCNSCLAILALQFLLSNSCRAILAEQFVINSQNYKLSMLE
jgi:hypothetical protein